MNLIASVHSYEILLTKDSNNHPLLISIAFTSDIDCFDSHNDCFDSDSDCFRSDSDCVSSDRNRFSADSDCSSSDSDGLNYCRMELHSQMADAQCRLSTVSR